MLEHLQNTEKLKETLDHETSFFSMHRLVQLSRYNGLSWAGWFWDWLIPVAEQFSRSAAA
jgi:hypothetical protein